MPHSPALDLFHPATRAWFRAAFPAPTTVQEQGWIAVACGQNALLLAPTGSGKTLAAFLWCLDRLAAEPVPAAPERCRVLYVSPLKALAHDVERNLKAPLVGIRLAAQRIGEVPPDLHAAIRTGDTSAEDRRAMARTPPDVLITTPESLYLMLTSKAREVLRTVRWVIVDEVHSLAGTKRGAHLALSLERLEALGAGPIQRIGLSATAKPADEIGRFLVGTDRQVTVVDAGRRKALAIEVVVPVEDMASLGRRPEPDPDPLAKSGNLLSPEPRASIWPSIHPRLFELVKAHRSTLIFVNSRRMAERLSQRLNEMDEAETAATAGGQDGAHPPPRRPLVRAHHGSLAREQRLVIEESLKAGTLRGIVATSSLELGIDMAAVDLVVQVESPTTVASGLQRIGRAGHSVDAVSEGRIFPKFRGDLLESAVVVRRMLDGEIESTRIPKNPLDVLAQQIVAMCTQDTWDIAELYEAVCHAYPFGGLPRTHFEGVLDMLSGRYPSDEFADLKPRLVWDRTEGTVTARADARVVAVTSGGTIPDRGLYGVFLGEGGPRVGELDEEMVYESRPGETFILGASTWRIESITPNKVIVRPAPGEPGKMPFWHGDSEGRPIELGRALGQFTRRFEHLEPLAAIPLLEAEHCLDPLAAANLVQYLAEQRAATGQVPTDRAVIVERFRDELGDWRVCVLTPFGARVHAPWGMAIEARLREHGEADAHVIWSDDGIAIRLPEALDGPLDHVLFPEPEEIEDEVVRELGGSSLFAARFRENAARALLLPRRRGGLRTPLWQMRQKAASLLGVASRYGSFPIILETYRECLQDVFDVPALVDLLRAIRQREVRVAHVQTAAPSPFASSLLFDYVAEFMYDGDAPLAERRAAALALDRERLRELLGQEELRELLDPDALAALELDLQVLGERRAKTKDQAYDLLRRLGDLRTDEVAVRAAGPAAEWLGALEHERRVVRVRIAASERWIAIEDVARYRDALGVQPPRGVPDVFLGETSDALDGLLARWARTHGPFTSREPAERWALPAGLVQDALRRLANAGTLLEGEFRPGGRGREWCDPDVLRSLRRRSLARLRREVEPVPQEALARFLPGWQGVGTEQGGIDRLLDVVAQLEGVFLPWSTWERDVLPARVRGYQPRLLDELCASGEVVWVGRGAIGADDGRVALYRRDRVGLLAPPAPEEPPTGTLHDGIRTHLATRGATFFRDVVNNSGGGATDLRVLDALWELVWSGEVTNDTVIPLRLHQGRKKGGSGRPPRLTRAGPPEAAGRWSLVSTLDIRARLETERLHAVATTLLERYGVVTREAAMAEGIAGGFSAVYPVLKAMEESGRVRRGYFVEGLGAAQFALPGAVDRLRAERESGDDQEPPARLLSASDPANPYGASVAWPKSEGERRGLARAAGAYVVLVDGEPTLYLERGGKKLISMPALTRDSARLAASLAALAHVADRLPRRELTIERLDGESILQSPLRGAFEEAGFRREHLGLTVRTDPVLYPAPRGRLADAPGPRAGLGPRG
ncbi:MAG: DEAD/DEAH box helicase [Chloroflexi bacterium]|nr:DEAD/DEAH box helicase [Chloroflexota bacterium]